MQFLMIKVVMGMVLVDRVPRWERKVARADKDAEADSVGEVSRDPRHTTSSCVDTQGGELLKITVKNSGSLCSSS